MGQMQDKIMKALRELAESRNGSGASLELVDQPQWANTGTAYVMDGFDTVAQLAYGFYDAYCTITFSGPAVTATGLADNPPSWRVKPGGEVAWHHLNYDDGERVKTMLATIEGVIFHA